MWGITASLAHRGYVYAEVPARWDRSQLCGEVTGVP